MGWLITPGASRADVVAARIRQQENERTSWVVLKHCLRGNVLWTVREVRPKDGTAGHRFIGCDVLSSDGLGWGFKDMDESCGPCYYSCPLAYFDLVPVPDGPYAAAWREKVRQHHREKVSLAGLKPGDTLVLKEGCRPAELTVVRTRPLQATAEGRLYRVPRKQIERIIEA